jgi:hypothetical protein
MAVKSLYQFFYYHSKYLNNMKCREISMGPSICTIQCRNCFILILFLTQMNQQVKGIVFITTVQCDTLKNLNIMEIIIFCRI